MVSNGSKIFLFGGGLEAFFLRPILCHGLENKKLGTCIGLFHVLSICYVNSMHKYTSTNIGYIAEFNKNPSSLHVYMNKYSVVVSTYSLHGRVQGCSEFKTWTRPGEKAWVSTLGYSLLVGAISQC